MLLQNEKKSQEETKGARQKSLVTSFSSPRKQQ